MKRQKRYSKRSEILSAIDSAHERMRELREQVVGKTEMREKLKRLSAKFTHAGEIAATQREIGELKIQEEKLNKKANRIEDVRLPRLKRSLAAFDTKPMAFSDEQVVLQ